MPFKLRLRKKIKIAPGVHLNVTEKGLRSTSIGGKRARITVSQKDTTAHARVGWFSWFTRLGKKK